MRPDTIVIVGGGQAACQTAVSLREEGYREPITLVTRERRLPYQRAPLSRGYLVGELGPDELELRPPSFYEDQRITVITGDPVGFIDRDVQTAVLVSGRRLRYRSLVLATGSRPRRPLGPGSALRGVRTLRTLDDAAELRWRLEECGHLVVIGAGLVGMEVAAVARDLGHEVTVLEAGRWAMSRTTTRETAAYLTARQRRRGVRILPLREVSALVGTGDGAVRAVTLNDGRRLPADLVVAGIGVLPTTRLAAQAGLHTGDGVLVDRYLRTSDRDIYAIGDCARFPSPLAGRHLRLETEQNAVDQARCLARGLCGRREPYTAVPSFSSDQFGLRLQCAGLVEGHDRAVLSGDPAQGRFSVYCYRGERLIGVESVNRPEDHLTARRLLASAAPAPSPGEVARVGFELRERVEPYGG